MKNIILSSIILVTLGSTAFALSPYEKAKMKKYGQSNSEKMSKNKKELKNIDKSGSLEDVKKRYLSKIASKKRTAPAMMKSKIAGIENCINGAQSISAVENCVPSMMK